MLSFKTYFFEVAGTLGGLAPDLQAPGGLSQQDIRKGRGSALDISRNPELDAEPPITQDSPTSHKTKYGKIYSAKGMPATKDKWPRKFAVMGKDTDSTYNKA